MTGDLALDRIDRAEPDPLKLAEDRVAEAGRALDSASTAYWSSGKTSLWRARQAANRELRSARAALSALRAQLAAEADALRAQEAEARSHGVLP